MHPWPTRGARRNRARAGELVREAAALAGDVRDERAGRVEGNVAGAFELAGELAEVMRRSRADEHLGRDGVEGCRRGGVGIVVPGAADVRPAVARRASPRPSGVTLTEIRSSPMVSERYARDQRRRAGQWSKAPRITHGRFEATYSRRKSRGAGAPSTRGTRAGASSRTSRESHAKRSGAPSGSPFSSSSRSEDDMARARDDTARRRETTGVAVADATSWRARTRFGSDWPPLLFFFRNTHQCKHVGYVCHIYFVH